MKTIQIGQRGIITIPAELRRRYGLEAGDLLTIVDLDGVLLLAPKVPVVPQLAREIARLREEAGLKVEDLLAGLDEQRRRYYEEHHARSPVGR